ncbi:TolC family protein [Parasediminibacterium sp. JCM 36343]|uniref:TolC family protein n=1 Tax=Parasediminibacterium sp. JCM 36343 TaxID=3374279 RepID=UPI003978FB0B
MNKLLPAGLIIVSFLAAQQKGYAQKNLANDSLQAASLETCVQYALQHKPLVQQALLDQQTTEYSIKSKLADWYPLINFDYNIQHNFQLPTAFFNGNYIKQGTFNTSGALLSANQYIFNKDVLLAKRSAKDVRQQAKENIEDNKIQVVVDVSKAFYDVLLSQKQVELLKDDINRLEVSLKNAYYQYQGGIVDKIDYKRATIALNNSKSQLKSQQELLKSKNATLKDAMGYMADNYFELQYDSLQMEKEMVVDTLQAITYSNRIEYRELETTKRLQQYNLLYYKWSYYPSVSAFGSYNFNFLNNDFSKLYGQNFPNSFVGLKLNIPLFEGNKRVYQTRSAELAIKRVDWDLLQLRSTINTQYAQALSAYKSNLNDFYILKDNLALAEDVYNTIQLQYKAGIKNYLEVITAETDLRSAQVNFTNALYQVLSSKVDVQQALGLINN